MGRRRLNEQAAWRHAHSVLQQPRVERPFIQVGSPHAERVASGGTRPFDAGGHVLGQPREHRLHAPPIHLVDAAQVRLVRTGLTEARCDGLCQRVSGQASDPLNRNQAPHAFARRRDPSDAQSRNTTFEKVPT